MIRDAIAEIVDGRNLSVGIARTVMSEMMSGSATPSQMAAFMTAMRVKGETEEELLGFATEMRANATKISAPEGAVDLCGTGGDGMCTLNVSTAASFIVASAGVPVAKHGNRSVSSRSGSADMLDALGIPFDLPPKAVETCLNTIGFGFMFAPVFHRSMRNVMPARKEIGIRTFYNILGPMSSPACVDYQLMGVYDPEHLRKIAKVLGALGSKRAMVVSGLGTDEITNAGETKVAEVIDGGVREYSLSPEDFGVQVSDAADIAGGSPADNARAAVRILRDVRAQGSEVVLMNAAAALHIAGKAADLEDGMKIARKAVERGASYSKLREFAEISSKLEAEIQARAEVSALRDRRLVADVMRTRSVELVQDIRGQIMSMPDGSTHLADIDELLISSPSALSVLVLRRLRGVLANGTECRCRHPSASARLSEALSSPGVSVIGEYKPRSPTSPPLSVAPDPELAAEVFSRSGIAAVSILQEPEHFGGSQETFAVLRSRLQLPILFKDFVVTDQQVELADMLGADAVLLIAKALNARALDRLIEKTVEMGMEPVVELHDSADIRKTEALDALDRVAILGLNCRDLRSLELSRTMFEELRGSLPEGKLVIAESGVRAGRDVSSLRGFDGVLVGSALTHADDMMATAEELVNAGRSVSR